MSSNMFLGLINKSKYKKMNTIYTITNMSETPIKTRNLHGVTYFPHCLKKRDCITTVFRKQGRCMAAAFRV